MPKRREQFEQAQGCRPRRRTARAKCRPANPRRHRSRASRPRRRRGRLNAQRISLGMCPPLVAAAPGFDLADHFISRRHVGIAALDVAQVVLMGLVLVVADAILRHDGAESEAEAVDNACAHAARRDAAGHDHGVDAVLVKEGGRRRVEEDRRCALAQHVVVRRVCDQRVELGARMALDQIGDAVDLPVRRIARAVVAHEARGDRHAGSARDREQPRRVLDRAAHQRRAAGREARIGEGALKIDDHDAGLLAETDLTCAVATFGIARHQPCFLSSCGEAPRARG